ncbi:MAG TPA: FG-GAP-like repeat-containing protein [Pyrinomonadaceae bacterium]|nr:FG-GAP-like repeat-containing protein [Pyrinomonadaceae bacterium]
MKKATTSASLKLFLLLAIMTISLAAPTRAQRVRLRGHIDPPCTTFPPNPSAWKFSDIGASGNVAAQGSTSCRGVFIYDVTDPDHPVLASWYNPTPKLDHYTEAVVVGNRGYFGSATNRGVEIVDLTDPYHPVRLGAATPANSNAFGYVHEIEIWGNYLVEVLHGQPNRIVKFINISDPANPVFVRDLLLQEADWVHATHIRGNRLFTSGWGTPLVRGRTEIYDLTNIETQAPTLLAVIEDITGPGVMNDTRMHSSWTSEDGNYLYSCRETLRNASGTLQAGDVRVYDIHNATQPVLVYRISGEQLGLNGSTPHNPVVKGNRLYVSWYEAGLQVFDISNPARPVHIGQYDTFPEPYGVNGVLPARPSADFKPSDMVCGGSLRMESQVSSGYNGGWAVYPFLGDDKILIGDMATGLYVMDATKIAEPLENQISDFDGDRRTDLSVYRPTTGDWIVKKSSDNSTTTTHFGSIGDQNLAGDFDGDGKADLAVWRPSNGVWYMQGTSAGFSAVQFGLNGDVPVPADYDADGRTDMAVWRPSSGVWYIQRSNLGINILTWGASGDKVFAADYEGDGKADYCLYRPSTGTWYILRSSSTLPLYIRFGLGTDQPLVADFDGDDRADISVYRPETGYWYIASSSARSITTHRFGLPGADTAIPADYDGDGRADIAVFRAGERNWYWLNSSNGTFSAANFGEVGDLPSPLSVQPK